MSKKTDLTPTMQTMYDSVVEHYESTGYPSAVSVKNQTLRALVSRGKVVVVSQDETNALVRPVATETDKAGVVKRVFSRFSKNKHRRKAVRNLRGRK